MTQQTKSGVDAITLLEQDHEEVEALFARFEQLTATAVVPKDVVEGVIRNLSIHAAVEEQAFYPLLRRELPDGERLVEEALGEHQQVKEMLSRLDKIGHDHPETRTILTQLVDEVRHHVEEERAEAFPRFREQVGHDRLVEIGDAMQAIRKVAPTKPHPNAPNTPPGNLVAGPMAGIADRVVDLVKGDGDKK